MTIDEFSKRFDRFRLEALSYIKAASPYRTGNLRANIKYQHNADGFSIIIDVEYMQYTEEKWTYNRRWGKVLQNPHEGWLRESVRRLAEQFAISLKGVSINVN